MDLSKLANRIAYSRFWILLRNEQTPRGGMTIYPFGGMIENSQNTIRIINHLIDATETIWKLRSVHKAIS